MKKRKYGNSKKRKREVKQIAKELIISICLGITILLAVSQLFVKIVEVNGYGMISTLRDKDIVLMQRTKTIHRFDLVAFMLGNKLQIRRVIGLPKDTIAYREDRLFVNDEQIDEKFIQEEINESQKNGRNFTENFQSFSQGAEIIPEDYYFVLGDNRPYATDSRFYGSIAKKNVIGIVKIRLLPINEWTIF